jgi:hypothetical protein
VEVLLDYRNRNAVILLGFCCALLISVLTAKLGPVAPAVSAVLSVIIAFVILIFRSPVSGLWGLLIYSITYVFFDRELGINFPFSYVVELICIVTWLAFITKSGKHDWKRVYNDVCLFFFLWFLISVLQLFNPEGASPRGWLNEIRTSGLDTLLLVPAGFMLFRKIDHLDKFLVIIIAFSLVATFNGIKQLHFGMFPGEQYFALNSPTHLIWGKLRVFSIFKDAGQFGASQAQLAVICGTLALANMRLWKRTLLCLFALFFFYGMLISGTRGALFALLPGIFLAVFLFKNIKILIVGVFVVLGFLAVLKYTHIGSSSYEIRRLRSALNPDDPSLTVRFNNQQIIREYLATRPFGGGLGIVGYAGEKYNSDKYISRVAPDSYWVKIWVMYGNVGFAVWFAMIFYVVGRCCGIVWNIHDRNLRIKLIALTSGFFGIFICSYGNEVMNTLPSSIIGYLSIVFVLIGGRLDRQLVKN